MSSPATEPYLRLPPEPTSDIDALRSIAPCAPARVLEDLVAVLRRFGSAATHVERTDSLGELVAWLRGKERFELPAQATVSKRSCAARVWVLGEVLRAEAPLREPLRAQWERLIGETSALRLFTDVGLPRVSRFASEALDRLSRRLLPSAPDDDLAELLAYLFPDGRAAEWLEEVPPALLASVVELLLPPGSPAWRQLREELADAVVVLAHRVSALGTETDVRKRAEPCALRDSPFVELPRVCEAFAAELRQARAGSVPPRFVDDVRRVLASCRAVLGQVHAHLEDCGVSVDLVFRIDLMLRQLRRIERLVALAHPDKDAPHGLDAARFVAESVRDSLHDRSVRSLVRTNMRLLAQKVVERTGASGEHYITSTRGELAQMLRSACGGGLLTAGTALLKFLIAWKKLPLFFDGLFASLNYAGSFVVMQLMGFTLATKQPSMTAAALAGSLKQSEGSKDFAPVASLTARITRSQLAAAVGNVATVIPTMIAVHFAIAGWQGKPFLNAKAAAYVVHSLDPFHGGTLFFAALTGFLLWASSMAGGWVENWAVYRHLGEAIRRHRGLNRFLGAVRTERLAHGFMHKLSGLSSSVALGVLLGTTPIVGQFFGIPLEVRHVTLSAGSLALAGCTVGAEAVLQPDFLRAAAGIGFIGLLNFGVSFALALAVALRAREVQSGDFGRLLKALVLHAVRQPMSFVVPPRTAPAVTDGAGGPAPSA